MNPKLQSPNRKFDRTVLAGLLLAAVVLPGQAQDSSAANLPRVDVVAPAIGVHAVCPAFKAEMQTALAQVAMRYREPGLLDVNFEVDGRRIGDVAIAGGSFDYRRATRHAVRSLACDNGTAGPQTVRLQVEFKDL